MEIGKPKSFGDYKDDGHNWITLSTGEYYPDILEEACQLYKPVIVMFGQILKSSASSTEFFMKIAGVENSWMRVQLARVFRKYVSPETPVEMLRRKSKAQEICDRFGGKFRPIYEVQAAYNSRPIPDEALCAILWEYKDRGKKGYDLTERFFDIFQTHFPNLEIKGPKRAGKDIRMGEVFKNYPNTNRPVDFVITENQEILAIGFSRYDSDRGGAQEDDRTGGYKNCADEILNYATQHNLRTKVIFVNDGPGLLLGSMWNDYASLENSWPGRIIVVTLRMVPERLNIEWLRS
ncbi:MAG: bstEII [candidate division WOR-3 bacterium]|nr:bstEII [candidate division WOR-3 bacterium]